MLLRMLGSRMATHASRHTLYISHASPYISHSLYLYTIYGEKKRAATSRLHSSIFIDIINHFYGVSRKTYLCYTDRSFNRMYSTL